MEIIVEGVSELSARFKALTVKADAAARNIVLKGAVVIAGESKKDFRPRPSGSQTTSRRTGRVYYKGAPNYPAQPPMPTNRSGNLRRSIRMLKVRPMGFGRWESTTGPTVSYGGYVEYGTSRARPFPFMKPALERSSAALAAIYEREWAESLL